MNGKTAPAPASSAGGRLPALLLLFVRTLRAAGLAAGPGKTLDAIEALRAVGLARRDDVYWALSAVLVERREQRELFDQAFQVFWRNPRLLERLAALVLSEPGQTPQPPGSTPLKRRLADALGSLDAEARREQRLELDMSGSWSRSERLGAKDFEQMSAAELTEAKQLLRSVTGGLLSQTLLTRRMRPDPHGSRIDLRASLRQLAGPRGVPRLQFQSRRRRPPVLVLLCDISGSMSRYARMLLHFAHALSNDRDRVHTFVFGTRLSNVSRMLRNRDVDQALTKIGLSVDDWDGGTCIGDCLRRFNHDWSRRVLGQGAYVVLISDGLDRDDPLLLRREAERLHKSCRRLIWLNPLLRYQGFEPRAQGVRALLPHVDEMRPAHNLNSLAELGALLAGGPVTEARTWQIR